MKVLQNFQLILLNFKKFLDEKSKLEKELEYKYERWEYLNNLADEIANNK